jgi:F0F1-type ATP synthase membrane subunit b/b'
LKRISILLIAAGLSAYPIFAAQTGGPQTSSEQKRLNEAEKDEFIGWRWANFAVLAAVLGFFAYKYGNPYFSGETAQIRTGLEEARARRADAERRGADVQKRLSNLGAEVEGFRKIAADERARALQDLAKRLEAETVYLRASTEAQIESFGRNTTLDLRRHAARLALQLAEERIRARMNTDLEHRLTTQFVEGLKG